MAGGKHASDDAFEFDFRFLKGIKESFSFVKLLIAITIVVVIVGGGLIAKKIIENNEPQMPTTEPVASVVTGLQDELEGYEVLGKIKIEKINVEQFILNSNETEALEKGVTKLYGGNINEIGNFCIAGHNYEHVFQKLTELEIGDKFTIIDKSLVETEYEIKDIYSVEPDDLQCLIPNNEKTEITLITCENVATTRLVVKAEKCEQTTQETENDVVEDSEENI